MDYASKLTPKEQDWLAAFNEVEYGQNPEHLQELTGEAPTQDQRRKCYRDTQRYKRNVSAYFNTGSVVSFDDHVRRKVQNDQEDTLIEIIDLFAAQVFKKTS